MAQTTAAKDYAKQGSFQLFFQSIADTKLNMNGLTHIVGLTLLIVPAIAILALLVVLAIVLETAKVVFVLLAVLYTLAFIVAAFILGVYLASAYVNLALATAQGHTITTAELKTRAWSSMWRIFVVDFLISLTYQIANVVQVLPFIGSLIGLVLTVLVMAFMAPAVYMVVHQQLDPIAAMQASYKLVAAKQHLGVFVKIILVFMLLIFLVMLVFSLVFIVPAVLFFLGHMAIVGSIWAALGAVVFFVIVVVSQLAYRIALAKRYLQLHTS